MRSSLLRKILRWISSTHRRHQFYPPKFHIRGIAIALLILIPALLWIKNSLRSPLSRRLANYSLPCPGRSPVNPKELAQKPFLFTDRLIWLRGTVVIAPENCPEAGDHCPPCLAKPKLQLGAVQIPLRGVFLDRDGESRPLSCRRIDCRWLCFPLQPGTSYSLGGYLEISLPPDPFSGPLKFEIKAFKVIYFCPLKS